LSFGAKGEFKSTLKAVSGRSGALNFGKEALLGRFVVEGDTLTTKAKDKTSVYLIWFEAVPGGMVLHLVNKKFTSEMDVFVKVM